MNTSRDKTLAVLRAASLRADGKAEGAQTVWSAAVERFSEKALCRKVEALMDRGLVEYGISARTCWITQAGHELLKAMEKQSAEGDQSCS